MVRLVVIAAVLALLALSAKLFVWPEEEAPRTSDAVVVLAAAPERLTKGLELVGRRIAPVLVISDGLARGYRRANRLCRNGARGFEVVCFKPDPHSTRGEAQRIGRMARNRRWQSVTVVTSTFHLTRARLLFGRCVDARVQVVGADYPLHRLPKFVFFEWVKLAYANVERGC